MFFGPADSNCSPKFSIPQVISKPSFINSILRNFAQRIIVAIYPALISRFWVTVYHNNLCPVLYFCRTSTIRVLKCSILIAKPVLCSTVSISACGEDSKSTCAILCFFFLYYVIFGNLGFHSASGLHGTKPEHPFNWSSNIPFCISSHPELLQLEHFGLHPCCPRLLHNF